MEPKTDLRRYIIDNLPEMKKLMIKESQIEVITLVSKHKVMSVYDLSRILRTSIMNASMRLKNLYEKGYLKRERIASPSGGYEFTYTTEY